MSLFVGLLATLHLTVLHNCVSFRSVLQWSTDTVNIWPYLKLHFAPSDCGKFISFANLLGTVNVNTFKWCMILFTLPVCMTELLKCQQLVYGQKQKYVQFVIRLKDLTGMINHMRLCKWWVIYWVLHQSIFNSKQLIIVWSN